MRPLFMGLMIVACLGACSGKQKQEQQYRITDDGEERGTCDEESWTTKVDPPSDDQCGDGKIGTIAVRCFQDCKGGCGGPEQCRDVRCERDPEPCDGDNLADATCESQLRGPGTLRCMSDCRDFDLSGCGTNDG